VSQADLLARFARLLDAAGVSFMVTGSTASSAHGTARATRDIDLVIDTDEQGVRRLVASLPPDTYYVSEDAAMDALARRRAARSGNSRTSPASSR